MNMLSLTNIFLWVSFIFTPYTTSFGGNYAIYKVNFVSLYEYSKIRNTHRKELTSYFEVSLYYQMVYGQTLHLVQIPNLAISKIPSPQP